MARKDELQEEEQAPAECCLKPAVAEPDYSGQGGEFVLNSSTGQCTLVRQTKPATEA